MKQLILIKLIQRLATDYDKKIFKLSELAILTGESQAAVGMALGRAEREGIVAHVRHYWINMMERPRLEDVALEIMSPSYISFESALYHHGVLSQSPRGALTLATMGKPAMVVTPLGNIQSIHLQPGLFFGFDDHRMAHPEKAFLDMIYIRIRKGIGEITETIYRDELNQAVLRRLSKKYPTYVQKALQN